MNLRRFNPILRRAMYFCLVATLLIGMAFSSLPVQVVHAATITVTNTNDSGAGSLRQAIADAASGDTITFDSSLNGQTITLTSAQLTINKSLSINGPGASNLTISGNNSYRVFNLGSNAVVTISGLTIANGYVQNARGGGISNAGRLTLDNTTIISNQIGGNLLGLLSYGGSGIYNSGTLTVNNSTVSDNRDNAPSGGGGGIFNDATMSLDHSIVRGNQVHTTSLFGQYGGGGICNLGTATITHSTIDSNIAAGYSSGGGGGIYNNGSLTLADSTVTNNRSDPDSTGAWGGYGGGILNWQGGTLEIQRSSLVSNVADRDGGVIINVGTLNVSQSTISGNVANCRGPSEGSSQVGVGGGGISNPAGVATLENCTISGNTSSQYGGGLLNDEGTLRLTFTTLSDNGASTIGGGIYITGTITDTFVYLTSTIIANSAGQDCVNDGGAITNTTTLIEDNTCNPNLSGDPALGPLQDNGGTTKTHALLTGSPAVDAGDNATCPATDQRGVGRPLDGDGDGSATCDVGAYEAPVQSTVTYDLTIAVDPAEGGATDPAVGTHTYAEGAEVTVTATPNAGYAFDHWSGACTGSGACVVTMDGDKTVTAHFMAVLPPAATLISPAGVISDTTPTYTWSEVEASTWYRLWVDGPSGMVINQWYRAENANCAGGVCGVTPATALSDGEHTWWIRTWNDAGYGLWSAPLHFSVGELPLPGAATLTAPSGAVGDPTPAYTWDEVEHASWYRLWVEDALGVVVNQWYRAEQVCAAGSCVVDPGLPLAEGPYLWWVQTWNIAGIGPWSAPLEFYVGTPGAPGPATLVSPTGAISDTTPTYTWEAAGGATWYRLLVEGPSGTVVDQWSKASNVCDRAGGLCEATPGSVLEPGEHSWWVKSWNLYGSTWSGRLDFTVSTGAAGAGATPSTPGLSGSAYRLYLPLMLKPGETGDTPPLGPPLEDGDAGPPLEMRESGPPDVDEESGPPLEELGPGSGPSAADEMCERDMGFYHRDANTPEGVVFIR